MQLEPIKQKLLYKSKLISSFERIILEKNYRQQNDEEFQTLLDNLRFNKLTMRDIELIDIASKQENDGIKVFCLNKDIVSVNNEEMKAITSEEHTYKAQYIGEPEYIIEIRKQFLSRGIDTLVLKKKLKVMLTRNDSSSGLVNGSIGVIKDFLNGNPIVDFSGKCIEIELVNWDVKIADKTVATARQIPLIMAYACSVHKCQGLTIEKATIDLRNAFCNHQIYVALSRVKSLDGLSLKNFNIKRISVNKETIDFLKS